MKKLIVSLILMVIAPASNAATFECTGYFEGSAVGEPIKVNAAKISVAETKAYARLKKSGLKVDYVNCK